MTTPISSSYAAATETQFVAGQKFMYSHDYVILDGAGKLRFELKRKSGVICAKDKRRLIDVATGQVVLLIVYDTPLVGRSWLTAYLGDSQKDSQELLHFRKKTTLRKSSTYEAFLAGNRDPLKPDFYIQKRLKWDVGFTILSQSGIIAEADKIEAGMVYRVTVSPGVDQAFVAALTLMWMIERVWEEETRKTVTYD